MGHGRGAGGPGGFPPGGGAHRDADPLGAPKWVLILDDALPPGRAVNAAACVASATARSVSGLLGPDAEDCDGSMHPGLPWPGCTVLAAPAARLSAIRVKARASLGVFVADMPAAAQHTRVYDEYLSQVAGASAENLAYYALSIVGPRNRVDKIVGKLPLMP